MIENKLTEEEELALKEAQDYLDLAKQPGFHRMLLLIKQQAENALLTLREDDGSDIEKTLELVRTWRERDKIIGVIESQLDYARSLRAELHEEQ